MDQELLDKAMKKLLDVKNEDKEDFLQYLESTVRQLRLDVDQLLNTLKSLSDMYHDFGPAINNLLNFLLHVQSMGTIANSAVNDLESFLIDIMRQTSEFTYVTAEKLQRQEIHLLHRAPSCFSDESLNTDIQALSEVIEADDRQFSLEKLFANDFKTRIIEAASSDPVRAWIPQFNDELAKDEELNEMLHAATDEIAKIDEELKQFAM